MPTSYAANAQRFMRAMKAADPAAKIGVPWAFGSSVQGASVPDNPAWNNTVLDAVGKYAGFVDAHYYPFTFSGGTGGGNPSDEQVLTALRQIPALFGGIRDELAARAPGASVVVGETAVSNSATTTACTPVGALFAAGDVLSWLAAGAESVDWWDLNNYGNTTSGCVKPDYGFFTSSSRRRSRRRTTVTSSRRCSPSRRRRSECWPPLTRPTCWRSSRRCRTASTPWRSST